jgi:hypothetical protein
MGLSVPDRSMTVVATVAVVATATSLILSASVASVSSAG